jgi:HAMP domain-containing protein
MMIALHKRARTTHAVRDEIAASKLSVAALAQRYRRSLKTCKHIEEAFGWESRP